MQALEKRGLARSAFIVAFLAMGLAFGALLAPCPAFAAGVAPQDTALRAGTLEVAKTGKAKTEADAERIKQMAVAKNGLYNICAATDTNYSIGVAGESLKVGARVAPVKRDSTNWLQKWAVVQDTSTGYYTLCNLRTRQYLTAAGKAKVGAVVKQRPRTSSLKQEWKIVKVGGRYQFRSAANPACALQLVKSGKSYKFILQPAGLRVAQRFRLRAVSPIDDGRTFYLRSVTASKSGVAVKDASLKQNMRLVLNAPKNAKAQKFRLTKSGTAFRMQCVKSCQYVGTTGVLLRQSAGAKGAEKRWRFALDLRTCTFSVKSVATGKYLDASSEILALRKHVKDASGAKVQRFRLVPTYGFTVFVDAGHGSNSSGWGVYDPGAEGCGYEEADLTRDLARRIQNKLAGTDVRVFNGTDYSVPYWQRNAKARSLGCDVILSVHFDAGGGSSTSTMVGTGGASGSRTFNSIIHRKLVSGVGLRDGGTSYRSDITVVNGSLPAVLMEVCFIDNYSSLHTYLGRRDTLARSLADGIVAASKEPSLQR